MKKIIVILMTIFLSGCFSPSSPEYREELHKLEELVKHHKVDEYIIQIPRLSLPVDDVGSRVPA